MSFTTKLFEALHDESLQSTDVNLDVMKNAEPSQYNTTVESRDLKRQSSKEDNCSTSSESVSDPEEKENSDDDRNHKHRRRDAHSSSFDNDVQEQAIGRPNRKRGKNYDTGQLYMDTGFQSREIQKEYNSAMEKEIPSRFEKRQFGFSQLVRPPSDFSSRSRLNLRADPGPRLDFSSSLGRASLGRGRGRNSIAWSQHDSRFNSLDSLDFASHMASQGPTHPGLFVGQAAGSSQNTSWNAFGYIHGISNGIMDPLHPLNVQATLRPTISPMNLGIPRQRCRDFEERGFCLRGDMCPMEHGVNRIVVEDVQSLSQFNLPISVPSSHALGVHAGTGPLLPGPASVGSMANKTIPSRNSKSVANDNALRLNGSTSSAGGEADVYDPDQPLWNNNHPDSSTALLRLPSPINEDEPLWDGDVSLRKSSRLSDGSEGELPTRNLKAKNGPQSTGSSVWGRIGSVSKSEIEVKIDSTVSASRHLSKETRDIKEDTVSSCLPSDQDKLVISEEIGSKVAIAQPISMERTDFVCKSGRLQQKASRTLYVFGIPQKNNRREALLSHFQKFGVVIDIYIPLNSEKAFVQFSKRDEAEAALRSPDAVMGNRFIKLFWANRDRISDKGQSNGQAKPLEYPRVVTNSAELQPPVFGGKENLSSAAQRKSCPVVVEASAPSVVTQKSVTTSGTKAVTSPTKKLESLELLEELRRKQELLAQKRDEFRRQLVKYEKQASFKKSNGVSEQAIKRHKIDTGSGSTKDDDSWSIIVNSVDCEDAGRTVENSSSGAILVSPGSRGYVATMQQSSRIVKQATRMHAPYPNRFKLDNRPTSFRVLPPLPAKLANVTVLKDHFSKFGELASIVFEDSEEAENSGSKEPENCFVCVTFLTRHSAEKAYQSGKSWEGCGLKFIWGTALSNSGKDCHVQEVSLNAVGCAIPANGIKAGSMTTGPSSSSAVEPLGIPISGSSSFSAGAPACCVPLSEVDAKTTEDAGIDLVGQKCASSTVSSSFMEKFESCPTIPIHENEFGNADELMVDDSTEAGLTQ